MLTNLFLDLTRKIQIDLTVGQTCDSDTLLQKLVYLVCQFGGISEIGYEMKCSNNTYMQCISYSFKSVPSNAFQIAEHCPTFIRL